MNELEDIPGVPTEFQHVVPSVPHSKITANSLGAQVPAIPLFVSQIAKNRENTRTGADFKSPKMGW